jgi:hypothetical protein
MRRLITIALLLILGLPMLSPLLAASASGSALPACCRRDGKHHCSMPSMRTSSNEDGATRRFTSIQERCPFCPSSIQLFGSHIDPPYLAETVALPFPSTFALSLAQTEAHYRISSDRARHKRGPPYPLLSLV